MNEAPRSAGSLADTDLGIAEVLEAYVERLEAGAPPDPERLLAEHPEIAGKLRDCLDVIGLRQRGPVDPTTPTVSAEQAAPGARLSRCIGDYELFEEMGRGGMGVVFRARHRTLGRVVAIKMLLAGSWASPEHQRRFRAEAEAAAALDHPNIVPIYETGEHEGNSYFSMRLIDGGSLADRLSTYAADPRRAARVVADIARAVHHAHVRGVLHRDLKPSNVLLAADGRPYVADFGLAKRLGAGWDPTLSGVLLGTPAYMAPEQAEGRRGSVTTASDVYGLGAILYALLTGKAPFEGDSLEEVLLRVREHVPLSPSELNRRVDRDLATICRKCLEKDPKLRYPTAEALAEDLERYLTGEPIQARAYGILHRIALWSRRRERIRQAGIFAVFLGMALLVWAVSGLLLCRLRLIGVARPDTLAGHLLRCILGFYIPMILMGWGTVQGKSWAIGGGVLVSFAFNAMVLGHITGLLPLDMGGLIDPRNATLRVQADAFILVLSLLLLFSYSVALVAWWSNRRR